MLDRLAERVGLDGWDIRWRNAVEVGDIFGTGQRLGPGVGLKKTLLAVRDAYKAAPLAGIGCAVKNTGVGNGLAEYGKVILRPEPDGSVTLFHSWTEMGQGVHTILMQMLCEELGAHPRPGHCRVDTERRARLRPDHRFPGHRARRPVGDRRRRRSSRPIWMARPARRRWPPWPARSSTARSASTGPPRPGRRRTMSRSPISPTAGQPRSSSLTRTARSRR